jgi:hypothetical protein
MGCRPAFFFFSREKKKKQKEKRPIYLIASAGRKPEG